MNEENNKNEENMNETEFTLTNIIKNSYEDFMPLLVGLIMSIISVIYLLTRKNIEDKKAYLIPILILVLTVGVFYFIHSPKPKKAYALSFLFDTDYGIQSEFSHKSGENSWPFVASSPLKINNEIHIFVGGGNNQKDALLKFNTKDNKFENIINKTNLSSNSNSYSSVSIDMDKDGKDDLIVGRKDGVYFYKNMGNYRFKEHKILNKLDKVPLAIAVSDYNKDGNPDIYLSYFTQMNKYKGTVFNDPKHGRKNILLKTDTDKNNNIKFTDVSEETHSEGLPYNTFTSAFVDLNNDGWPDIVLSHDSGEIEILENEQGKSFKSHIPFNEKGNFMGLAVGDIDGDGDEDLFFTNLGEDAPKNKLSIGDIKKDQTQVFKHILLRNDGDFKFVESNKGPKDGFGWGAIMTDPDLDGDLDLFFAENTLLFPKHYVAPSPGSFYENKTNNENEIEFSRKFKYRNHRFGQTPMSIDVNDDNIKDIIWINMEGPVSLYISDKINNNYIVIELPKTIEFVNAKVIVDTGSKKIYRENIIGGTGLGGDTNDGRMIVGLGKIDKIDDISIHLLNGKKIKIKNPKINSILKPKIL